MDAERWAQIKTIFFAAAGRPADERPDFIRSECGGDESLAAEVESLLDAHERAGSFIEALPSDGTTINLEDLPIELMTGRQVGPYQVIKLLGRGGMGEVYLAEDARLGRQVALKLLPAQFTALGDRVRRFEQEARSASSLNHPNILTVHDIGEIEGRRYLVTEYVEGETLRQRMKGAPQQRIELGEALDVATQVAAALAAAHEAGIAHRDIKPENVMRRPDGVVKVLDFGLAKLTEPSASAIGKADPATGRASTESGVVMGTPNYMSPEQARGQRVDARTDIWSFGVMLYEMVSGRLPFEGATSADVLSMILHREPPSILLYRGDVPAELGRIVEKALTKEREERYQSAKDVGLDLKRLKRRLEVNAELERSLTPEEKARRSSEPVAAGGREVAVSETTAAVAAPRAAAGAAQTVSSAESALSASKRHKLGAVLVVAALVIASALVAFAYFSYFGSRPQAIASVAVLPFANTGGDPEMEYLSDGLSESLINNLSQLPALKVSARGSAFRYKGKEVDPEEVAKALGVQAIVTGRIVQRGEQLQVSAELMDVRDKTQMWGEQYNRRATDLLQVQAEISQRIAEKLRLTSAEQQQLAKEAKANPQAYEMLLKGRFHVRKTMREGYEKAVEYYNQAIAIDPNYALAYAGLAQAYRQLGNNGYLDPKEMMQKAEAAAKKALELDESLAEAHSELAGINLNAWDWAGAEREYKRAIELNPNYASAHGSYAFYLGFMGQHEQAIAEAKRAREIDPLFLAANVNIGYAFYSARQYEEAIEQLKKTLELDPNFRYTHVILAYAYAANGEYASAIAEYREAFRLGKGGSSGKCYVGYALAKAGQRGEAEAILKQLETTSEYVSPAELAVLYAALGEKEKALSALERAYAAHDLQMRYLGIDSHYDSLRSEPRFQDLVRKVGLPQ